MKPKHLAFTTVGMKENPGQSFQAITKLVSEQVKRKIPVFTFHITHKKDPNPLILTAFTIFLESEYFRRLINQNKIKITILGKWYNLSSKTVDAVKKIIDETKDYDHYFLNFCINYDGQEEIVDACKLLTKQVLSNKLSESAITPELIKENLYTSYFIPPDLIIKSGSKQKQSSFLLWDSVGATFFFTRKSFADFAPEDLSLILRDLNITD